MSTGNQKVYKTSVIFKIKNYNNELVCLGQREHRQQQQRQRQQQQQQRQRGECYAPRQEEKEVYLF